MIITSRDIYRTKFFYYYCPANNVHYLLKKLKKNGNENYLYITNRKPFQTGCGSVGGYCFKVVATNNGGSRGWDCERGIGYANVFIFDKDISNLKAVVKRKTPVPSDDEIGLPRGFEYGP